MNRNECESDRESRKARSRRTSGNKQDDEDEQERNHDFEYERTRAGDRLASVIRAQAAGLVSTSPKPATALISAPARMAPTTCAAQYAPASAGVIPRLRSTPNVTAGLMWQPETGPMAYAKASSRKAESKAHANLAYDVDPKDG